MPKIISNKSNVDLDYPICRPSLDLDFTQEVLDERITFTRGSTGTRVNRNRLIETVSANQPRFDYDPVTGECKGLLIEESRQNLLLQSNGFDTASWSKNGVTLISNSITSPDGTTNAYKQVENATSGLHRFQQGIGKSAVATTYTFSVFVKSGERNGLEFGILDAGGYVDCFANSTTGVFAGVPTINGAFVLGSYGSIAYSNGWYKFYVTATTTAQTGVTAFIGTTRSVGQVNNYQGDGTSGIYIWGAQLEAGAFPTSYIPTSGSTVTRSADVATMTGTNFSSWYNSSEGTLYAAVNNITTRTSMTYDAFVSLAGTDANRNVMRIYAQTASGGSFQNQFLVGFANSPDGIYTDSFDLVTSGPQRIGRVIFSYKQDNFIYTVNGLPTTTSSTRFKGNVPVCNRLLIFGASRFQPAPSGTISRLTYYPRALQPNQLQSLTA